MNTTLNSSVSSLAELPAFAGPQGDSFIYGPTPEQWKARNRKARKSRVAALAYYRIMAVRAAARKDLTAATFYRRHAELYSRRPVVKIEYPHSDLRAEVASWVVMIDVIRSEAHLTAEDYRYA